MLISWVQKTTLLDYPGKLATIIFTPGCNFRCGFCHNAEFVLPEKLKETVDDLIPEEIFMNFLKTRVGFLDGVVVCGWEPTLQSDLVEFCGKIKHLGFLVKLDTNGWNPDILRELLEKKLIDYVAMDFKHTPEKFHMVSGVKVDMDRFLESVDLLLNSEIDYEFRTTVIEWHHTIIDIETIAARIHGARNYYIQNYRAGKTLDPNFRGRSFLSRDLLLMKNVAKKYVRHVAVRM